MRQWSTYNTLLLQINFVVVGLLHQGGVIQVQTSSSNGGVGKPNSRGYHQHQYTNSLPSEEIIVSLIIWGSSLTTLPIMSMLRFYWFLCFFSYFAARHIYIVVFILVVSLLQSLQQFGNAYSVDTFHPSLNILRSLPL